MGDTNIQNYVLDILQSNQKEKPGYIFCKRTPFLYF
ncbi:hypothetical protein SAMN05444362_1175 [Dysgonomonas macrotermitis]|uniref:Uncharacterized protein n=1 Tax=Dysgonomonas macrotermitis TaxID=1346286 RepID=A0A1M5HQT6_9BACT|nr:hypothetical protein SAMN05444362_1175 [Dysgonomonas macrotermitis]